MDALVKKREWLLPVILILFLLVMIFVPLAVERTYAGRNESPSHTLTYTTGNLVWDRATDVDAQTGVAELRLFESTYQSVEAADGDKVVAPGTEGKNIVRLQNDAGNPVSYIAVLYRIKDADFLPVQLVLAEDTAFTEISKYPLPTGVTQEQVVRAVAGTVDAWQLQDFDITWQWKYHENDSRDQLDTDLGKKAAWDTADEVTVGLYIIVADEFSSENLPSDSADDSDHSSAEEQDHPDVSYTYPEVPETGDSGRLDFYLFLMAVSGILFLLLMMDRRKEKKCRNS